MSTRYPPQEAWFQCACALRFNLLAQGLADGKTTARILDTRLACVTVAVLLADRRDKAAVSILRGLYADNVVRRRGHAIARLLSVAAREVVAGGRSLSAGALPTTACPVAAVAGESTVLPRRGRASIHIAARALEIERCAPHHRRRAAILVVAPELILAGDPAGRQAADLLRNARADLASVAADAAAVLVIDWTPARTLAAREALGTSDSLRRQARALPVAGRFQ
jgi:hypothetical protein